MVIHDPPIVMIHQHTELCLWLRGHSGAVDGARIAIARDHRPDPVVVVDMVVVVVVGGYLVKINSVWHDSKVVALVPKGPAGLLNVHITAHRGADKSGRWLSRYEAAVSSHPGESSNVS